MPDVSGCGHDSHVALGILDASPRPGILQHETVNGSSARMLSIASMPINETRGSYTVWPGTSPARCVSDVSTVDNRDNSTTNSFVQFPTGYAQLL